MFMNETARTIWIIELGNGRFAGSPITVTAPNRNMSGTFTDKTEAEACARMLGNGAKVVSFR